METAHFYCERCQYWFVLVKEIGDDWSFECPTCFETDQVTIRTWAEWEAVHAAC